MLSSRAFRILSLGAAIALTLAACGGGSGTPTPPPAPVNVLERDNSFGTAGEARFSMGPLGGYIGATTAQSDGQLLLAGYRTLQTGTDLTKPRNELFVRRLLANGQADAAFGQAGETVFSVLGDDNVQGILVQPDGKIVVVLWVIEPCNAGIPIGSCFSAAGVLAKVGVGLVRLNADGTLDGSFGNQGVVIEYIGAQRSAPAPTVVLQPDGKLLMLRTPRIICCTSIHGSCTAICRMAARIQHSAVDRPSLHDARPTVKPSGCSLMAASSSQAQDMDKVRHAFALNA